MNSIRAGSRIRAVALRFRAALALGAAGAACGLLPPLALPLAAQDGVYTDEQADAGDALYEERCTVCHGELGAIIPEMAALLADHTFRNKWQGQSLGELFEYIQETMPQDAPGTLTGAESAAIVATILRGNRVVAGETPLSGDPAPLHDIPFDP